MISMLGRGKDSHPLPFFAPLRTVRSCRVRKGLSISGAGWGWTGSCPPARGGRPSARGLRVQKKRRAEVMRNEHAPREDAGSFGTDRPPPLPPPLRFAFPQTPHPNTCIERGGHAACARGVQRAPGGTEEREGGPRWQAGGRWVTLGIAPQNSPRPPLARWSHRIARLRPVTPR